MKGILISGKARSGKDQSAIFIKKYIEKELDKSVIIVKYGNFLKGFLEKSLNWDGNKDEYGRYLLQYWGTDIIRKNYEYSFTDMMIALLKGICNQFDYFIISDVRFPNEVDEIKKYFKCVSLRIDRDNNKSILTRDQKAHLSEIALDNYDFDAYICNNDSLNILEKVCTDFCKTYLVED